jgi:hypothetical protein
MLKSIFKKFGYIGNFSISAILVSVSAVYLQFFVREPLNDLNKQKPNNDLNKQMSESIQKEKETDEATKTRSILEFVKFCLFLV